MKTKLFFTVVCIIVFIPWGSQGQDVKFKPKFLSLRNFRLSTGISFELSEGSLISYKGTPDNAQVKLGNLFDTSKAPYFNYAIDFDLYSPNSLMGIWTGLGYSVNFFNVQGNNNNYDNIEYRNLEIPLYLKFRTGQRNGKIHAWFAAGISYNFILACNRNYYMYTSAYNFYTSSDNNNGQMNNYFSIGGLLGFELVNYGKFRLVVFARSNYAIQNLINNSYNAFQTPGNSAIADYPNFSYNYLATSIGIKLFYKVPKKLPK